MPASPAYEIGNAGTPTGQLESRADTYRFFDQLPVQLRRLIAYAPFDFAVEAMWDAYRAAYGAPLDLIAASWRRRIDKMVAEAARREYGPSHPQAGI